MTLHHQQMRLYDHEAERLYLNTSELSRFLKVSQSRPLEERLFAMTLAYTGLRLSEARYLRHHAIQTDARILSVPTLKKRALHVTREVPLPQELVTAFKALRGRPETLIWSHHGRPIPRITIYRWIKAIMHEADITGPKACPKGLRHAFGVRAILSGVPLHMLQRWMGHASMETTAIYATVLGPDQLQLADRMWLDSHRRNS